MLEITEGLENGVRNNLFSDAFGSGYKRLNIFNNSIVLESCYSINFFLYKNYVKMVNLNETICNWLIRIWNINI